MEHVAMLAAVLFVGVISGLSYHRCKRFVKAIRAHRESKLELHPKLKPVLDKTKRRSLQPGTRATPKGYIDPNTHVATSPPVKPPAPEERAQKARSVIPVRHLTDNEKDALNDHFTHKFFGSQLVVGDRLVIGGLSRRPHTVEITKENRVFVDNVPFDMAQGDAFQIKSELIRSRAD